MSVSDPRAVFRPPQRNCGTCQHWPVHLAGIKIATEHGALELPCEVLDASAPGSLSRSNYENGWRRGSDSCNKWSRRT